MPYEYRKLTSEERQIILQRRREQGFPLHSPPHPYKQIGNYLITAANYEHQPIMAHPDRRDDFETRLLNAMRSIDTIIFGWVILPNHYHILIGIESLEQVSAKLRLLHGSTSREWNKVDRQTEKRHVWYKFSDRAIRNEAHLYSTLNYIHFNPVKHGYVSDPYNWAWTSLGDYLEMMGKEWLREKWRDYAPKNFGHGWDDWKSN
jgi:putative transposase